MEEEEEEDECVEVRLKEQSLVERMIRIAVVVVAREG